MRKKRLLQCLLWIFTLLCLAIPVQAIEILDMISPDERQKIRAIETIRIAGVLQMSGLDGKIELIFAEPDRLYTFTDIGILNLTQGFDGETAWIKDQNGQLLELTGSDKQTLVSTAYSVGMSYFLEDRMPGNVEHLKDTLIDDQSYYVFSALPDGGDSLWLFFNAGNHRLEITREKLDEVSIYSYLSDFRNIDGIEIPFKSVTRSSIPQLNSILETVELEFNIPVDYSIFSMSRRDTVDYYYPEDADSVAISFDYYNGRIFLKAGVGGNEAITFILDSGAGSNIIDKTYAEEIGLEPQGDFPAKGIAGYGSAAIAGIDSLNVGEIKLFGRIVGIIDLSAMGLKLPGKIGGVLGFDLLSKFPFRVDYDGGKLVLYNPEHFRAPDSELSADFQLHMKVPLVEAFYGDVKGQFLVDFGNPLGLVLHKSYVDKHNLKETFTDIKGMGSRIGGVGGVSRAYAATGSRFRIGSMEISGPALMVAEGEHGVVESTLIDGNIGNLLLQKFSVVMDYDRKKLYILPSDK